MYKLIFSTILLLLNVEVFGQSSSSNPPKPVVLITGASQGIGLATAKRLSTQGYTVYAATRDPSNAKDLQVFAANHPSLIIKQLDIISPDSIETTVQEILKEEGRIFALINNAGFGIFGPVEIHTSDEIQKLFETNLFSVIRLINAVIPSMRNEKRGRILNLSSIAGVIPSGNIPVYSATKFALEAISASYAKDLSPWNIKVSLIQPGPVVTNFESSTCYGTRFNEEENPYLDILINRRQHWKEKMQSGQTPEEIAFVIQKALEDPNPNLWVQTSQSVIDAIKKHYKDPSGNTRIPLQ